jgi:hypothetical protein
VHEGAEKKGDAQWGCAGGWERARGFSHVLRLRVGVRGLREKIIIIQRTSSNFALPEGVTLTGWMPSSPVVESKKRRKVW